MAREREIKIELKIPLTDFIQRISEFGFQQQDTISQEDTYFDTPDWFLYKNVATLRLRRVNNKDHSFTFKKVFYFPQRSDSYHVEELETSFPKMDKSIAKQIWQRVMLPQPELVLSSGLQLGDYILAQGWQAEQCMRKQRIIYTWQDNEIVIDDVDQVGIIIEIECAKQEPTEFVDKLLQPSEWQRNNEGTSYLWLEKVKGLTDHRQSHHRWQQDPQWNVWKHEQDFYNAQSQV